MANESNQDQGTKVQKITVPPETIFHVGRLDKQFAQVMHRIDYWEATLPVMTDSQIIKQLSPLIDQLNRMFKDEERGMLFIQYKDYIKHKIEHDNLLVQLNDLNKRLKGGQKDLPTKNEAPSFLKSWHSFHKKSQDIPLGAQFVKAGYK